MSKDQQIEALNLWHLLIGTDQLILVVREVSVGTNTIWLGVENTAIRAKCPKHREESTEIHSTSMSSQRQIRLSCQGANIALDSVEILVQKSARNEVQVSEEHIYTQFLSRPFRIKIKKHICYAMLLATIRKLSRVSG